MTKSYTEVKKVMACLADLGGRIDETRRKLKKLEEEQLQQWREVEDWLRGELIHQEELLKVSQPAKAVKQPDWKRPGAGKYGE